jgi:hypothetical protein
VATGVPGERGDTVAGLDSGVLERVAHLLRPAVDRAIGRAFDSAVFDPAGDDLAVRVPGLAWSRILSTVNGQCCIRPCIRSSVGLAPVSPASERSS